MANSSKRPWKPAPLKPERDWSEYRQWLIAAEIKSQEDFDKTVLSLSGGALGISFVFLKDVIGTAPIVQPVLLMGAWLSWTLSASAVLASFFLSHLALRHAVKQVDSRTILNQKPGGKYARATAFCNILGAILFFVGIALIMSFAYKNFTDKDSENVEQTTSVQSTAEQTDTASASEEQRAEEGAVH